MSSSRYTTVSGGHAARPWIRGSSCSESLRLRSTFAGDDNSESGERRTCNRQDRVNVDESEFLVEDGTCSRSLDRRTSGLPDNIFGNRTAECSRVWGCSSIECESEDQEPRLCRARDAVAQFGETDSRAAGTQSVLLQTPTCPAVWPP